MKIDPSPGNSGKSPVAPVLEINCTDCRTSEHLIIESVQSMVPRTDGWVSVEYSCGKCESFYAHDVSVQAVARFLATADAQPGVLKFGRQYIHCGEPMEEVGMNITGLSVDGDGLQHVPEVRIPAVVLKCRCGFQMAIPK